LQMVDLNVQNVKKYVGGVCPAELDFVTFLALRYGQRYILICQVAPKRYLKSDLQINGVTVFAVVPPP